MSCVVGRQPFLPPCPHWGLPQPSRTRETAVPLTINLACGERPCSMVRVSSACLVWEMGGCPLRGFAFSCDSLDLTSIRSLLDVTAVPGPLQFGFSPEGWGCFLTRGWWTQAVLSPQLAENQNGRFWNTFSLTVQLILFPFTTNGWFVRLWRFSLAVLPALAWHLPWVYRGALRVGVRRSRELGGLSSETQARVLSRAYESLVSKHLPEDSSLTRLAGAWMSYQAAASLPVSFTKNQCFRFGS